jgi:hypothetical protein
MRQKDQARPEKKEKLAMSWFNDQGVIPFDIYAGADTPEWFSFITAPGTSAINIKAHGKVEETTIDGKPMTDKGKGHFEAIKPVASSARILIKVTPKKGYTGGAVIPEPITIETGTGSMPLGDWSEMGVLNNYSGGVTYRKSIKLSKAEANAATEIDLGHVTASAEVLINGKKVGVRVAPPWKLDVSGYLQKGNNTIEITVYNTLANHYQTIPSQYKGDPASGLMGPVKLKFK